MVNLAKEIKEGSEPAFEIFYKAEYNNIVFFLVNYLHDRDAAMDIAQEALLALWENRDMIDEERGVRTLAFTIARNKALNVLKSKYSKCNSGSLDELRADMASISSQSIESYIDSLSLEKLISQTYKNLSKTGRESFILSRQYGYSNEEIARMKGISIKAVEYHIRISLKFFRKRIKNYLPFFLGALLFFLYN